MDQAEGEVGGKWMLTGAMDAAGMWKVECFGEVYWLGLVEWNIWCRWVM